MTSIPAEALPTLAGVAQAAAAIRPYVAETPLVRAELLSRTLEADVWIKNETVTPIASFKLRGALNAVLAATGRGRVSGAVTASTGNHGQGVAYACRLLGLPAEIFLPEAADPVKKRMIQAFGGTVRQVGRDSDEAKDHARAHAAERGLLFVDDGESLDLMHGAGTVGWEVARQLRDVDALIVPMGGGSLAAGCAAALKGEQPGARVVAVQSTGSPAMVESFHARTVIERPVLTLANGLACRVPAKLALHAIWRSVDDAWLVPDRQLLAAVRTLVEAAHLLAEPSGAAALAGAWAHRDRLAGQRIVLIVTSSNVNRGHLEQALAAPPLFPDDAGPAA
jgi:threonine dehydratase